MKIKSRYYFTFTFLFFVFSCTTYNRNRAEIDIREVSFKPCWKVICGGIQYARMEYAEIPLAVTVLKIDLQDENIKVVNTPPICFAEDGKVYPETVMRFAGREKTQVAMNACFFKYKTPFDYVYKPLGIHIYNGEVLNSAIPKLAALFFTKEKKAVITARQDKIYFPDGILYAVSGFNKILEEGKICNSTGTKVRDSRTVAGTDSAGNTLFMLFAEGENKWKSRGMSIEEAAYLIRKLGASEALQLDGGGSSCLVINRLGKLVRIVPSCMFRTRKTATNFGFKKTASK